MTRESRAKWLAFATAAVVVLLAALFSVLRNLPATPPPDVTQGATATNATDARADVVPDAARVAAGERAYERLGCAGCHSIAGRGRPSSPLDGVGRRLDRTALREFTTGTGAARERLGPGLAQRKARALPTIPTWRR
jgi:mono/diheme cytochrome c family protein